MTLHYPANALGVNQEKLNALIKSVTDDFQKAEYSLLRRSNDLYRQTIYKAQIGLNTGSITLNQAIDMATKDFLSNGINSIRYKNGNLVNIASYSEMALRTAEKRATMYGDGEKRQEWDIDTVVVYGHNGACPLCSRWQNRVYIDDVYSNGKPNNKYPLLSVAIQGGLYHPNCKCPPPQTYIEGITDPPTQKTPQELEKDIQNYNLEQVQRYNERQIRKYKRLEANSLDDANKKRYSLKVKEWQSKQRELINNHPEVLKRDYSREKIRVLNITEPPKNATNIDKINLTSIKNSGKLKDIEKPIEINSKYHKGKIIFFDITDERINKVPLVEFDTLSNENSQKLQQAGKDLLTYMKDDTLGREGLITFDLSMKEIDRHKGDVKKLSVSIPRYDEDCIVIHNHPSGLIFSPQDLETFSFNDEIRILGAIGNNGSVYYIEKTDDFDNRQFDYNYDILREKYGYINNEGKYKYNSPDDIFKFIEELLNGGGECGFNTYIFTN